MNWCRRDHGPDQTCSNCAPQGAGIVAPDGLVSGNNLTLQTLQHASPGPQSVNMGALLPCPFCGSDDIDASAWLADDSRHGPGCMACGATAESAERWNRRCSRCHLCGLEDHAGNCSRRSTAPVAHKSE